MHSREIKKNEVRMIFGMSHKDKSQWIEESHWLLKKLMKRHQCYLLKIEHTNKHPDFAIFINTETTGETKSIKDWLLNRYKSKTISTWQNYGTVKNGEISMKTNISLKGYPLSIICWQESYGFLDDINRQPMKEAIQAEYPDTKLILYTIT